VTAIRLAALGAVALALGLHAGHADAAPTPRVAVLIGEVLGVAPADADALGASLATALGDKLVVDAIGGADVARRLPPAGLPDECLSTPACVADLGARLGADRLLVLAVVRAGVELQIDATMIDVATGAGAPRPRLQVADLAAADAAFAEAATRYLPEAEERTQAGDGGGGDSHRPITRGVWVTGGVGIAALIGSGVLGLTIKSKYDRCNDEDHPCGQDTKDSLHNRALIADVTLGVGVVAVAIAVVLYARTPLETSDVQPAVSPVAGGAVVGLGGRF
jgi:hypothetical protein